MNNIHSPPGDLKIGPITSNTITDYSFRVFSLFLGRWAVARLARGFAVRNEAAPGTRISPFHRDPADAVTGPVHLPGEIRGLFRSSRLVSDRGGVPSSHIVSTPVAIPEIIGLPLHFLYFLSFPLAPSTSSPFRPPWSLRSLQH